MRALAHRFLFLIRHPPLPEVRTRETLDRILTVAAFDQWVTLAFIDDGVLQLVGPRSTPNHESPAWLGTLRALELYNIHGLVVDEDSLWDRGLTRSDLAIAAEAVARDRIKALVASHSRLFVC